MVRIRNLTEGPKGVHTRDDGLVFIAGGEAADLDLSEGERAAAGATGWFEIEPARAAASDPRKDR
jgi:hypothetical protein